MPNARDMTWFKGEFHTNVAAATHGTPFDLSMITALASQETGSEIWGPLSRRGQLTTQQILDVCVGDVITGPRRTAFPTSRANLEARPRGREMYTLARECLASMAAHVPGYAPYVPNPERFCHGYGILQYDLQFFTEDPDYFLNKDYADIDKAVARCVSELKAGQARIPSLRGKPHLTDTEMAFVAIAYNTGGCNVARGLKQGFKDSDGVYYGEHFFRYLGTARSVPDPAPGPVH